MTKLKLEELEKDIEENMLVNGEHITINKTQRKKLKTLLNSYNKIDVNEKNQLQLHLFHSRLREILAISNFDTIEYNIPNRIIEYGGHIRMK